MAVEVGDVVEWERGDNDVIDTVVCSTDAECRTGRCRLIDAGNEIVFAEDIPEAFAAVDERRIATEMKAAPACDSECVDANRIPSVRAPPLALCDIDYAK